MVPIACAGVLVESVHIPPFELRPGQAVCLHFPYPVLSHTEHAALVQTLSGERPHPGYRINGRAVLAVPASITRLRLIDRFWPQTALGWLCQSTSRAQATAILQALDIPGAIPLHSLAGNPRTLLALHSAWANQAQAVIFSTAGCDPRGVEIIFSEVRQRLEQCSALYLSTPHETAGKIGRNHFPGSSCFELAISTPSRASVA